MSTHIDYAVTEVIPVAEPSEQGEQVDPRWRDQEKQAALLKQQQRLQRRVAAEGFDD